MSNVIFPSYYPLFKCIADKMEIGFDGTETWEYEEVE